MPGAATKTGPPPFWSWHTRSWPSTPLSTRRRRPSSTPGSSAVGTPPMPWPRGRTPASISPSIRSMRRSGLWRTSGPWRHAPLCPGPPRGSAAASGCTRWNTRRTWKHCSAWRNGPAQLWAATPSGATGRSGRPKPDSPPACWASPPSAAWAPKGRNSTPPANTCRWTPCCRVAR